MNINNIIDGWWLAGFYNILSKVIAIRLKMTLPSIVYPMQYEFFARRDVLRNILNVHKIVEMI